ncbi:hypothetical protein [Fodinicurvata fenggangensis]|uniref:hypothetical protein n=1 Tax=Fodinicurvata fenggangensis TaxID=1121830 RepID=UPI000ACC167F|nr:hypothetical protein [Fodinicurvata fenggangensis]
MIAAGLLAAAYPAYGGEADVLEVQVNGAEGLYRFEVTVRHTDEGWDHYANAWEVVGPDGEVLATRELAHPHVEEQPFTRSLPNVEIPDGISEVSVRARDSVHGYGGEEITVELP